MIDTILAGLVLGTIAALAPGPYTTMVVGTSIERGFRPAAKLALTPLVTDVPPMVVTAFLLDRLNWTALTMIGLAGGTVVAAIGLRYVVRHGNRRVSETSLADGQSAEFWHVAVSGLLSPAPWLFWLVVASPLMLRGLSQSWLEGGLFAGLLFATNMGTATALAWAASHGARLMTPRFRRRTLRVVGSFLMIAGVLLIWQAFTGNFQAMIERQDTLRGVIETSIG